jgi:hypothetical protein
MIARRSHATNRGQGRYEPGLGSATRIPLSPAAERAYPSSMRIELVSCLALISFAAAASPAPAGGINLAWNDCYGAGGVINRDFACNTNAGTNDLYISFEPPVSIPDVNHSYAIIDLVSAGSALPSWWQFKNPGSCRQSSLSATTAIAGTCPDMLQGLGVAGIASYSVTAVVPQIPLNRARILGEVFLPDSVAFPVSPGTEYSVLRIRIANTFTVGTACTGCTVPVCLVLSKVLITSSNSGDFPLTNPLASQYVTWQGGGIGGLGCPLETPTVNRTWGQVKSIYR